MGRMAALTVRGYDVPDEALHWRFSRSSGPGGQGVNTTDSRVELSLDLARGPGLPERLRGRALDRLTGRLVDGVLTVVASEHRSQWRNRQAALKRMSVALHDATAPPPLRRRPTRPSRAAQERRLEAKRNRSRIKRMRRSSFDA
jgi:ribosome-associated protein